jgi:hypothetical protein
VNEDESLRRYGLSPVAGDLDEVRGILAIQAARERRHQGDGDTELMKLCCVQLFNAGFLTDALLIWHAKESSWDACRLNLTSRFATRKDWPGMASNHTSSRQESEPLRLPVGHSLGCPGVDYFVVIDEVSRGAGHASHDLAVPVRDE